MPMFRRNLITIEARQLVGNAAETIDVINWVRNTGGYPWLLGDATNPETLIPEGGDMPGGEGVYLDPATGELVIHTFVSNKRATYGDWILCDDLGVFDTMSDADFKATYDSA